MRKIDFAMLTVVWLVLVPLPGGSMAATHIERLVNHPGLNQGEILDGQSYQDLDLQIRQAGKQRSLETLANRLAWQQERWEELLEEMNQLYAAEIQRAQHDAQIDRLSQLLRVGSQTVRLAASYQEWHATQEPGTKEHVQPETGPEPRGQSDSIHTREYYERIQESCKNEECKIIDSRRIFREMRQPLEEGRHRPLGQMDGHLDRVFENEQPSTICDGTVCIPVSNDKAEELLSTPPIAEKADPSVSAPAIFQSLSNAYQAPIGEDEARAQANPSASERVFSAALDFWGPTAFPKGVVEVLSGKDPVTGEEVSRVVSGVGILVTPIPGGKVLLKKIPARHLWKTGLLKNSGKRIAKGKLDNIFRNPDKLTGKTPIDLQKDLGILPNGWITTTLARGGQKDRGGWVLREVAEHYERTGDLTGKLIRYHPGGGRHGPNPYWIVSSSKQGTRRIPAGQIPPGIEP